MRASRTGVLSTLACLLTPLSASSSSGIGDYIAAGLRKDASDSSTASSSSVTLRTTFASNRNSTSSRSIIHSSGYAASISVMSSSMTANSSTHSFTDFAASTSSISSANIANSSTHPFVHIAAPSGSFHNLTASNNSRNASLDDSCWNSWSQHWSLLEPIKTTYVTTAVSTDIEPVVKDSSTAYWYITVVQLTTITQFDGAHAIATDAFTDTETYSWPSTVTVGTSTVVETITTSISAPTAGITAPPCVLPSFVPECQSSWDSWESKNWELASGYEQPICVPRTIGTIQPNQTCVGEWLAYWWFSGASKSTVGPSPSCTQASVTGEYCSKEISRFLNSNSLARISRTLAGWTVTTNADNLTETVWPPDRSLAPGCTMGCQQCRITGSSVELFWWPPQTAADDGLPVTAVGFGTTFTSPTVYISFDTIFASDSCSGIGKTYSSTILAIPHSTDVSSLWGMSLVNGLQSTAAFNYTDLLQTNPVPTSIFNRQPRCVSSWWWQSTIAGPIDEYDCDREYPYMPILSIPVQVQNMDPEWANCVGGIEGVYDPPIALTSAKSAFKPTLPTAPHSTTEPAAPKSTAKSFPTQTEGPKFTFDPITTPAAPKQKIIPTTSPQDVPAVPTASAHSSEQSPDQSPAAAPHDSSAASTHDQPADSSPEGSNGDPPASPKPVSKAVISIGGIKVTAVAQQGSGPVEIAGQTLTHGEIATIQNQVVSVGHSAIVVDGQTAAFHRVVSQVDSQVAATPKPFVDAVLTIGSHTFTAAPLPTGGLEIGGKTLTPGGAITIKGHTLTAGPKGIVIDGSSTLSFSALKAKPTALTLPLGSEHITAAPLPSNRISVNGHTLSAGEVLTIHGHEITALRNGIVMDGRTATFSKVHEQTAKAKTYTRYNTTTSTGPTRATTTSKLSETAASMNASSRILTGSGAGWLLAILAIALVIYA